MSEDNKEKIVVINKRNDVIGWKKFFSELQEKFDQGYRIHISNLRKENPIAGAVQRVFMVKDTVEDAPPKQEFVDTSKEVDLDSLTKKKDLVEYAEKSGIEIPEDLKQPAAIKKHIQSNLS